MASEVTSKSLPSDQFSLRLLLKRVEALIDSATAHERYVEQRLLESPKPGRTVGQRIVRRAPDPTMIRPYLSAERLQHVEEIGEYAERLLAEAEQGTAKPTKEEIARMFKLLSAAWLEAAHELRARIVTALEAATNPRPGQAITATHSPDFRSVVWFGTHYEFTKTQAACVKVLWETCEQGTPDIDQQTILTEADASSNRLVDVFRLRRKGRRGYHPAWRAMIVQGKTKGTYRLQEPSPLTRA